MKHHSELLNYIAKKIDAKTYVEIGVFDPDHNFNKIDVPYKIGVDPDPAAQSTVRATSDDFFSVMKALGAGVDLVWIDGLHHAEQVKKDIENAWEILNPGGVVALHDCNPPSEQTTCIPRGTQREWCGDVYRAISTITWPNEFFTIDFDYGCCVIRKDFRRNVSFSSVNITWKDFEPNRRELIHLTPMQKSLEIIESWI